jgi:CPA1 family monovalent cation:H+ antiporter
LAQEFVDRLLDIVETEVDMEIHIERIELLLLIAAFVAMLAKRFRFPYTVGLLIAGVSLTFLPFVPSITLTKELIFSGLLPPLIFEAALFLHWNDLRKILPVVLVLASVGLLLSALVTGFGMYFLLGWPRIAAGIFGVLIAATDPVSVIATFKEAGGQGRLRILVEAESLFNDGMAAVLFGLVLAFFAGSTPTPFELTANAILVVGGGLGCGAVVAQLILYVAGKTRDHLVELTLTTVAAYGSFMLAEHFHWSGVLATLTAGLIVGNRGHLGAISEKGRESVEAFWEFAAFIANSLIFILIGIHEAKQTFSSLLIPSIVAIALVLLGRAVAIYPLAAVFSRSAFKISMGHQHILVWGGLRGALALALALGLPLSVPFRAEIITVAFAVVAFSVVIQGLTITPLMVRLGLLHKPPKEKDSEGRL